MSRFCSLVVALSLLVETNCHADAGKEPDQDVVKIGVIAGLTGEYASVFKNWVNGITLAREQYERSGTSPRVELIVEDDEFKATKGLSAYRKLINVDHVSGVLNGSSATIGAIASLVKRHGIPLIQMGEETEEPTDDNILQIMPGNIDIEFALGKSLSGNCQGRLALFYTLHPTMNRFARAFKEGFGHPVFEFEMDPANQDVAPLVLRALKDSPNCIAILAFPPQGALLVRHVNSLSKTRIPLAFDSNFQSGMSEYERLLGNLDRLDRSVVAIVDTDTTSDFRDAYRSRFGEAVGPAADLGFDAFNLLMSGYSTEQGTWIANLKQSNFQGAGGLVIFDNVGIRKPKFTIMTVGEYRKRLSTR